LTSIKKALPRRAYDALMDRRELIALAAAIEERRGVLLEEVRADLARLRGSPYAETHDAGDESVADLLSHLSGAEASRDVEELRALEAARRRIAEGTYGICADCGGDIGAERLRAEPAAARCIDCQRRHEKTYRD
jgi:RNA polymerase-binding transcription factor DksA